jgi:hypothetical protein
MRLQSESPGEGGMPCAQDDHRSVMLSRACSLHTSRVRKTYPGRRECSLSVFSACLSDSCTSQYPDYVNFGALPVWRNLEGRNSHTALLGFTDVLKHSTRTGISLLAYVISSCLVTQECNGQRYYVCRLARIQTIRNGIKAAILPNEQ